MRHTGIQHPAELSQTDLAAWRTMAASASAFGNPLLGPDFAVAVGELRSDARVAVFRRAGEAAGFLPFHATASGLVRPIGGALSDYHALVSAGPLGADGPALLAEAGLAGFRFSGLIDPHGLFAASGLREAHRIVLDGDPEAYLDQVRAVSPKKFKNYRRLDHKLDREVGALRLVADDGSSHAFEQLLQWKRDQLHRTGSFDFLSPAWTTGLLRSLFERRDGDFCGLMISLYAGERLVAGHFGVRLGATYHPWIASTDPELAGCSPGQIFLLRAIEAMPQLGLATYDLGPGHDHYKRPYAFTQIQIAEGAALSSSAGWLPGAIEGAWSLAGAGKGGMVGKVRRRLDAIAAAETTVRARVRGVISAAANAARAREAHAGAD